MRNIFQGSEPIMRCIAESFGYTYEPDNRSHYFGWVTNDFYFQAFFYLTNRFGPAVNYDDYKTAGSWNFKVKDFIIQITFLSERIEIIIFGEKWHWHGGLTPGSLKMMRESQNKSDKLLRLGAKNLNKKERALFVKVANDFFDSKGIDKPEDELTNEDWEGFFDYAMEYNNNIVDVDVNAVNDKYGNIYSNSYTRRALKTLSQFLKNMLTPIWVRDCSFCFTGAGGEEKYVDNIRIECTNDNVK